MSTEIQSEASAVEYSLYKKQLQDCKDRTGGLKLNLSNMNLYTIPNEVLIQYPLLQKLDLQHNELEELPEEFAFVYPQLTYLNISKNKLKALPTRIGKLKTLQTLLAEDNRIQNLPPSFMNLVNLKYLNLRRNQLTSLCDINNESIQSNQTAQSQETGLSNLTTLLLGYNQLPTVPKSFSVSPYLCTVDLQGNGEMSNLPEKIQSLHEQYIIYHSKEKRKEYIKRALRIQEAVAHGLRK